MDRPREHVSIPHFLVSSLLTATSRLVGDPSTTPNRKYFSVGYYVEHPTSLGFVHIRDGSDPTVPPEFETGFLKTCVSLTACL